MIDLDTSIEEALNRHPGLAHLFVRHRMICVGCAIARFHTVRDVALMYQLDPERLLSEMHTRITEPHGAATASVSPTGLANESNA
jgi:hybrid cluster-associated redox disulfide protein